MKSELKILNCSTIISDFANIFIFNITFRTRNLIKNAILNNEFLKNFNESQIEIFISVMYPKKVKANTRIIQEGETGK